MSSQERRENWLEHVRRAQREGRSVAAYGRSWFSMYCGLCPAKRGAVA
jgi:hypothetical protein